MAGEIGGLFPGARLIAPDAEEVIVDLEGESKRPTKVAEAANDLLIVAGKNGARFNGSGDESGGLATDHLKVVLDALHLRACACCNINELPFAEP